MLGLILLVQALTVAVSSSPTAVAYLPIHVAQAEGYFTREGLAVTLRTTAGETEAASALFDRHVDLAATTLEIVVRRVPPRIAPGLRMVAGLTAAPSVALVGTSAGADPPRTLAALARRRIAIGAPGPDETWLGTMLARARLDARGVTIQAVGPLPAVQAVQSGDVAAAYVEEPFVSQLLAAGHTVLADLRTVKAAAETLDAPTVHAAVFAHQERLLGPQTLAAFTRALLAAEARIAAGDAAALAAKLPAAFGARPDEFAARVAAAREAFLRDPTVSREQIRASLDIIRERMPLSPMVHLPSTRDWMTPRR